METEINILRFKLYHYPYFGTNLVLEALSPAVFNVRIGSARAAYQSPELFVRWNPASA